MDHTQSTDISSSKTITPEWVHGYLVRYAIFLITCMCVGLPMAAWALRLLRLVRQRQQLCPNGGRGTKASWAFVIALLLTDLLEALLSPAMVAYLFSPVSTERSGAAFVLFYGVKYCAAHLHQMVALEAVLVRSGAVRHSRRWQTFSVVMCIMEAAFLLLCLYVDNFVYSPAVTLIWFLLSVILLTCMCRLTLHFPPLETHNPGRKSGYAYTVLTVATSSFILLYGPFLAFVWAQTLSPQAVSHEKYVSCLQVAMTVIYPTVCLRLLADPLLCVLVLRESLLGHN